MTQDSIVKVTIGYGPTSLSMMKGTGTNEIWIIIGGTGTNEIWIIIGGTGTNEIWIIIGLNESSDDDDHDDNYWAYGKTQGALARTSYH
jgi:hypothetical protein